MIRHKGAIPGPKENNGLTHGKAQGRDPRAEWKGLALQRTEGRGETGVYILRPWKRFVIPSFFSLLPRLPSFFKFFLETQISSWRK